MLGELLECCCPDTVGGADEDADEICGEGEGDLGVGEVDGGEGDHCVVLTDRQRDGAQKIGGRRE